MELIRTSRVDKVEITLERGEDGGILIQAEYPDGDVWELLTLNQDGTFLRHGWVGAGFFKLDDEEKIVEIEEE